MRVTKLWQLTARQAGQYYSTVARELEDIGNYMHDYWASYKWYLSATPFPQKEQSLLNALAFIDWKAKKGKSFTVDGPDELAKPALPNLYELIHKLLFWRNTKTGVASEYKVPEIIEEVIKITLSDVERGMYMEAARYNEQTRLRMLCCHPMISDYDRRVLGDTDKRTLEEIRTMLIDDRKAELERTLKHIEDLTAKLADPDPKAAMTEYQRQKAKKDIEDDTKRVANLKSTLAYMESIVPQLKAVQEKTASSSSSSSSSSAPAPEAAAPAKEVNTCPICYDEIRDVVVTTCGHMFCKECLQSYMRSTGNNNCPSCRHPLKAGDICEVVLSTAKAPEEPVTELGVLTQTHGAKMAHLILYLRKIFAADPTNRAIVFSEWDTLLQKVGGTLLENGISVAYMKGNVRQRMKALREFTDGTGGENEEGTKVIMLSLENSASGLNLVQASHLILLEPVGRSAAETKAIETQAIGRAHRLGQKKHLTVVRLITKDTIEEELFARNTEPVRALASSQSTLLRNFSRGLSSLCYAAPQPSL